MNYKNAIGTDLKKNISREQIARKIFLSYPTFAFIDKHDLEFDIKNEISLFLNIPITRIHFTGSAKTGFSAIKNTVFDPEKSDLDVSVIDKDLFLRISEESFMTTKGLTDLTKFKDHSTYMSYKNYLAKGIFRPDLMPSCKFRKKWWIFFNQLSNKYVSFFHKISAGVYQSECFFELKQSRNFQGNIRC